jgi:hypothetical protein
MLFVQSTAPTTWTKGATHNNKTLRVVTGNAASGGNIAFTTAFASQAVNGNIGNTTLATNQIPSHSHNTNGSSFFNPPNGSLVGNGDYQTTSGTGNTGGGQAHNHSFTGTAIDLAVQYVDVIIATKD